MAKQRFKERLTKGEKVGDCACHDDTAEQAPIANGGGRHVVGARFIDSGQVYFFDPRDADLQTGDWIVVESSRGQEAARVVIAPHQVAASQLKGELKPIVRKLSERDIRRMESLRKETASAIRVFSHEIRARRLPMKPISAEYNFDGSQLTLNFSSADRVDFRELARDLNQKLKCRIELHQVSARDEARLLGGLGRCGRTLCCSTWLPMFPEITMGMAKTQDLSLNPSKVSGVCGRLLCCLSYENEQYKQMKAVMPKLGQKTETPHGPGTVVSMQLLKGLVTILLDAGNIEETFPARELGFGEVPVSPVRLDRKPKEQDIAPQPMVETVEAEAAVASSVAVEEVEAPAKSADGGTARSGRKRRRRRNRGHGQEHNQSQNAQGSEHTE
ncbi:MAG TPA: regulatory iron-sulfur-containing complex subunit RicT [Thermomicrobiales bacterium]|nr:regulatory iron-sulfur-containing complex subunit RicT [Thermomicrobiales bacterium]